MRRIHQDNEVREELLLCDLDEIARQGARRMLIEALEAEERALNSTFGDPGFYKEAADTIRRTLARLEEVRAELAVAYARWDELDSRVVER